VVGGTDARNSGTDYQNVNMVIAHFKSSKTSKNYALKMHRNLRWRDLAHGRDHERLILYIARRPALRNCFGFCVEPNAFHTVLVYITDG
jgi:hypothetical protein